MPIKRLLNAVSNPSRKHSLQGLQPGDYIVNTVTLSRVPPDWRECGIRERRDSRGRFYTIDVVARVSSIQRTPYQPGGSSDAVGLVILGPKILMPRQRKAVPREVVPYSLWELKIDWALIGSSAWLLDRSCGLDSKLQVPLLRSLQSFFSRSSDQYRQIMGDEALPSITVNRWSLQKTAEWIYRPAARLQARSRYWILFYHQGKSKGHLRWGLITGSVLRCALSGTSSKVPIVYVAPYAKPRDINGRNIDSVSGHNLLEAMHDQGSRTGTYISQSDIRSIIDGADLHIGVETYSNGRTAALRVDGRNPEHVNLQEWDFVVHKKWLLDVHGRPYEQVSRSGWVVKVPSSRSRAVKVWSQEYPGDYIATNDRISSLANGRGGEWIDRSLDIKAVIETAAVNFDVLTPQPGQPREPVYVLSSHSNPHSHRRSISYHIRKGYIAYPETEQLSSVWNRAKKHWLLHKSRLGNDLYLVEVEIDGDYYPTWYSRRNIFSLRIDAQTRLHLYTREMSESYLCRKLLERGKKEGTRTRSKSRDSSRHSSGYGYSRGGSPNGGGSGDGRGRGRPMPAISTFTAAERQRAELAKAEDAKAMRRRNDLMRREAEQQAAMDAKRHHKQKGRTSNAPSPDLGGGRIRSSTSRDRAPTYPPSPPAREMSEMPEDLTHRRSPPRTAYAKIERTGPQGYDGNPDGSNVDFENSQHATTANAASGIDARGRKNVNKATLEARDEIGMPAGFAVRQALGPDPSRVITRDELEQARLDENPVPPDAAMTTPKKKKKGGKKVSTVAGVQPLQQGWQRGPNDTLTKEQIYAPDGSIATQYDPEPSSGRQRGSPTGSNVAGPSIRENSPKPESDGGAKEKGKKTVAGKKKKNKKSATVEEG